MKIGITGLPYVGKTTIFNAVTGANAFPSSRDRPNISVIKVPDIRIDNLADIFKPKKTVYADLTFIDTAGLAASDKNRCSEENIAIQSVKQSDAIAAVIPLFEGADMQPKKDIDNIEAEFILSDLSSIENRLARIEKQSRGLKDRINKEEYNLLIKCMDSLEHEKPLRTLPFTESEIKLIRSFQFLSLKPVLYILNISEDKLGKDQEAATEEFEKYIKLPYTTCISICGKVEFEISQLSKEDAQEFLSEMGVAESSLSKVIRISYDILKLISFFTVGKDEVKAWTIKRGTTASSAAGVIHSDIERGFIRAEVVGYNNFIQCGSLSEAKRKSALRLEGKNYIVKDGDIINFRFNV